MKKDKYTSHSKKPASKTTKTVGKPRKLTKKQRKHRPLDNAK